MADSITKHPIFRRCYGNVRTPDGQKQIIIGVVTLEFNFQNRDCTFEFLVIPTIRQDIICGIDFWWSVNISVSLNGSIGEYSTDNVDKVILDREQERKLKYIIQSFNNSERNGLGCTLLLEHNIDTGDAKPIKQSHYPISPAKEKLLCEEIDKMLTLGVIEECRNLEGSFLCGEQKVELGNRKKCIPHPEYRWYNLKTSTRILYFEEI